MTTATIPTITVSQSIQLSGLHRILARVDEWLPESLKDGQAYFKILLTDIDRELASDSEPVGTPYNVEADPDAWAESGPVLAGISFTAGSITPKQVWDSRNEWEKDVENSLAHWNSLDDAERARINDVVKSRIESLIAHPEALAAGPVRSGNFIDYWIDLA